MSESRSKCEYRSKCECRSKCVGRSKSQSEIDILFTVNSPSHDESH